MYIGVLSFCFFFCFLRVYINRRITLEFVLWLPQLSLSLFLSLFTPLFVTVAAWYLWDLWQGPPRLNVCLLIFIQIYFSFASATLGLRDSRAQ